jgi:type VI secretion system protein ImpK
MQSTLTQRATVHRTAAQSGDDLAHIATPALELIMQVRAGLVQPSNDLRPTMDGLLKQLEQNAKALNYPDAPVQATKFALAAFADETVLTANFPFRDEWEKYPLQLEYFGEQLAGVKFYERLEELMKLPEENADVIEVYYLCLLVGYKGKYKIYFEDQLRGVIEQVADSLRRVNRLRTGALSPHWRATDQPRLVTNYGIPIWAKMSGAAALGLLILLFLVFSFWLNSNLGSAIKELLR